MERKVDYTVAVVRMVFVVLLLLVMAAPQLLAEEPSKDFAKIRVLLETTPLVTWLIIGAAAFVGLVAIQFARTLRSRSTKPVSAALRRLPIEEAVLAQHKGNGLASDMFPLELPWLGIAGWLQIEPGKECIVIDGKRVIRQTQICFTPLRFIGKPIYARRVLLQPAALTDLSAKGQTSDQFALTLVTTVKYTVTNPVYVATQQAPITQLVELISGRIAEYVRSDTLENIFSDSEGTIRKKLKVQMESSPSVRGYYSIAEVLKALPTGDERVIELIRKIRFETNRSGLIEQEGANALAEAEYKQQIKRREEELRDEFARRQHERDLEMKQMTLQFQVLQEVVSMVGQVASSGVNPAGTIEEIRKLLQSSTTIREIPRISVSEQSLLTQERQILERHQAALGITSIAIGARPDKPTAPGQAEIVFPEFTLFVECSGDYPQQCPSAYVQLNGGNRLDLIIPWQAGNHLLEVAATAKMRVKTESESRVKPSSAE